VLLGSVAAGLGSRFDLVIWVHQAAVG